MSGAPRERPLRIWDVSEPLEPGTAVFPGDTPFSQEWVMRIERGASCNVSTIRMSVHAGTHGDAPLHYDAAGHDVASADLRNYLGRCRVLAVGGEGSPPLIPATALGGGALRGATRILFKTKSTHDHRAFEPGFTALGPAAAKALVEAGVVLAGIDTPSMDHADSKELETHHVLRKAGIALLENLDLSRVEPGDYELIALPLKIVNGDASPIRAILRELPEGAR